MVKIREVTEIIYNLMGKNKVHIITGFTLPLETASEKPQNYTK